MNGVSQGNYFLPKSHKLAGFEEKRLTKTALAAKVANLFLNGRGITVFFVFCQLTSKNNNKACVPSIGESGSHLELETRHKY